MTIGIDASRANRSFRTGTEWYSFYLIKYLAQIDSKNVYILYIDEPLCSDLAEVIKKASNFKVKLLKWPFRFFWTQCRLSLEMLFKYPNVLFVPAHAIPFIHPRKTITTLHDVAFARDENIYEREVIETDYSISSRFLSFLVRIFTLGRHKMDSIDYLHWSTKFALKHAKKIITVSEFTKKEVLSIYKEAKEKKIQVVYNGFNNVLYKKINDQEKIDKVLKKYGIPEPYFLYVGRLDKKKNTAQLVESFAIFKENNSDLKHKLVLLGSVGFGYDKVKFAIEEFNLENDIKILGWIDENDMPAILNGADAFVFPSLYEGFGIPVIQSLACGVPTIISDIPVLREIAKDSSLYFEPRDKYSIASAMREIVSNQTLRTSLIKQGYDVANEYSWRKCAKETLEVIRSL